MSKVRVADFLHDNCDPIERADLTAVLPPAALRLFNAEVVLMRARQQAREKAEAEADE